MLLATLFVLPALPVVGMSGEASVAADRRPTAPSLTSRVAERAGISWSSAQRAQQSDAAIVHTDGTVVIADEHPGGAASETLPQRSAHAEATNRGFADSAPGVDELFHLHSNPAASHTLYLDVDGAELMGTVWNGDVGRAPNGTYDGFSLDDDPAFSPYERQLVAETWRETAAHFAAFDIDVTTERPSDDRMVRTDASDTEYGVWVIVSSQADLPGLLCPVGCGGVAILGQYDRPDGGQWQRPAFAFSMTSGTIAHEVGHTLGLMHDGHVSGGSTQEYYRGHGSWRPIMGSEGIGRMAQWSRGDYEGASNTEDDFEVMAEHGLAWRPDGAGGDLHSAAHPAGTETLSQGDVDVFTVPACAGKLSVVAEVPDGGGLDISLDLLDADGEVVSSAERGVSNTGADGTDFYLVGQSEVLEDSTGVVRFARVRQGSVDGAEGYPTYGSVGGYELSTGCDAGAPPAPRSVEVTASFRQITATWQPPAAGHVTGYRVRVGGETAELEPGHRARVAFAGGPPGVDQIDVAVQAVNGDELGAVVETTVAVPPAPTLAIESITIDQHAGTATVHWTSTIAPEIQGASVSVDGHGDGVRELAPVARDATHHTLGRLPAGDTISVDVCVSIPFRENTGYVACENGTAHYPEIAAAPVGVTARLLDFDGNVEVSWARADAVDGYQISVDRGPWENATSPHVLSGLDAGRREVRVRALTASGPGSSAIVHRDVRRAPAPPEGASATPSEDGTSVTVDWRPPSDTRWLTGYLISDSSRGQEVPVPLGQTSYTLTDLTPGSRVDIFLRSAGAEVPSEAVFISVSLPSGGIEEPEEPSDEPTDPSVDEPQEEIPTASIDRAFSGKKGGRATVRVRWSVAEPGDGLSSWRVEFVTADPKKRKRRLFEVPADVFRYEARLPKNRRWKVRVRALGSVESPIVV